MGRINSKTGSFIYGEFTQRYNPKIIKTRLIQAELIAAMFQMAPITDVHVVLHLSLVQMKPGV